MLWRARCSRCQKADAWRMRSSAGRGWRCRRCRAAGESPHVCCAICARCGSPSRSTGITSRATLVPQAHGVSILMASHAGLRRFKRRISWRFCRFPEPGQSPDPHQRRIAVGIDLGTTHSLVAAVRNGVADALARRSGACAAAIGGALRKWAADRSVLMPRPRRRRMPPTLSVNKRFMGEAWPISNRPRSCLIASRPMTAASSVEWTAT